MIQFDLYAYILQNGLKWHEILQRFFVMIFCMATFKKEGGTWGTETIQQVSFDSTLDWNFGSSILTHLKVGYIHLHSIKDKPNVKCKYIFLWFMVDRYIIYLHNIDPIKINLSCKFWYAFATWIRHGAYWTQGGNPSSPEADHWRPIFSTAGTDGSKWKLVMPTWCFFGEGNACLGLESDCLSHLNTVRPTWWFAFKNAFWIRIFFQMNIFMFSGH